MLKREQNIWIEKTKIIQLNRFLIPPADACRKMRGVESAEPGKGWSVISSRGVKRAMIGSEIACEKISIRGVDKQRIENFPRSLPSPGKQNNSQINLIWCQWERTERIEYLILRLGDLLRSHKNSLMDLNLYKDIHVDIYYFRCCIKNSNEIFMQLRAIAERTKAWNFHFNQEQSSWMQNDRHHREASKVL